MDKRDRCMVCARNVWCERCVYCHGPVCVKCSVHIQQRLGAVDISCYSCAKYESAIGDDAVGDERSGASRRCRAGVSNRSGSVIASVEQSVGCEHGPGESSAGSEGGRSKKRKAPADEAEQSDGCQVPGPVVYCIRSKRRKWKAGALTPPA
eukprot:656924-Amphidinium_carterae.1